jgi:hypothetical protein
VAKKQTRRGVHFRRGVYEAIREFCAANDLVMVELIEAAVCNWIGMAMPVAPRNVPRGGQIAHRLPNIFHRLSPDEVARALRNRGDQ